MKPIAVCAFLMIVLLTPRAVALEVGDPAPPFANPDLKQKFVLSKEFLGRGWLLLDFFATDCEACKRELPELETLAAELAGEGLKVIVMATDSAGAEVVEPYFRQNPTPLLVLLDRYRVVVKRYGVEEIPSLFLVDPEGKVAVVQVGYREGALEEIRARVRAGR